MSIATQEWRDGCATGAAALASRLAKLEMLGVRVTREVLESVTSSLRNESGGAVSESWLEGQPDAAALWEEGFNAAVAQDMKQREDPSHAFRRDNPYKPGF